jgi:hypothetical protein
MQHKTERDLNMTLALKSTAYPHVRQIDTYEGRIYTDYIASHRVPAPYLVEPAVADPLIDWSYVDDDGHYQKDALDCECVAFESVADSLALEDYHTNLVESGHYEPHYPEEELDDAYEAHYFNDRSYERTGPFVDA